MSALLDWPEISGTETPQEPERRHMTPAEKARVRRAAELERRRQADAERAETFRLADADDTSGNPFSHSIRKPLAEAICHAVADYMRDPAHRAEFEAWYLERHGVPYVWPGTAERNEK